MPGGEGGSGEGGAPENRDHHGDAPVGVEVGLAEGLSEFGFPFAELVDLGLAGAGATRDPEGEDQSEEEGGEDQDDQESDGTIAVVADGDLGRTEGNQPENHAGPPESRGGEGCGGGFPSAFLDPTADRREQRLEFLAELAGLDLAVGWDSFPDRFLDWLEISGLGGLAATDPRGGGGVRLDQPACGEGGEAGLEDSAGAVDQAGDDIGILGFELGVLCGFLGAPLPSGHQQDRECDAHEAAVEDEEWGAGPVEDVPVGDGERAAPGEADGGHGGRGPLDQRPGGGLGNDPDLACVHASEGGGAGEAVLDGGPDVRRRRGSEPLLIGGQGAGVPIDVLGLLGAAAAGGTVVEGEPEYLLAPGVPVVVRVDQVEMPGLIDGVAGRHRVSGAGGEEEEAAVFVDDAGGVGVGPAVVAGEATFESEDGCLGTDGVGFDPVPEVVVPGVHVDVFVGACCVREGREAGPMLSRVGFPRGALDCNMGGEASSQFLPARYLGVYGDGAMGVTNRRLESYGRVGSAAERAGKKPWMEPGKDDESRLVERASAGDEAAFGELVRRLQEQVFRILHRHAMDPSVAEDLAQETFLRMWRHLGRFDGRVPLEHWVSRIAVRVALDHGRVRRRRNEVGLVELGEAAVQWLQSEDGGEPGAADAKEILTMAFGLLGVEDRMVLTLLELEGRAAREVSDLTGWSVVGVRVRAFRARRRLRRVLDEMEEKHEGITRGTVAGGRSSAATRPAAG